MYNRAWEVVIKMSFINPNEGYKDYLLQNVEVEERLEDYSVYIYLEEDEYARYDVRSVITEKPIFKMMNDLQRLPPLGLFRDSETIKSKVFGYFNKGILEKIVGYTQRGRTFILEVKSEEDLKLISKLVSNNDEEGVVKVFDKKDYQDELDWCEEKINKWSESLEGKLSNNIKYSLTYYMKNNHDKWNDIKLMFDIEEEVNESVIEEYFEGMETYNTDDWVDSVILGNRKGKNFVILDYIHTIKGFKPYIILDMIKNRLESYLELIQLYDKGVIHGKETNESQLLKRCEYLGIGVSETILSDKRYKLIDNLTVINRSEVEYAYSEVLKMMVSKNRYKIDIKDLVYLIDIFRLSKTKDRIDEINKGMFKLSRNRKNKRKR